MSASTVTGATILRALDQRVAQAATILLGRGHDPAAPGPAGYATACLLPALVDAVHRTATADSMWLLITAVAGRFPTCEEVHRLLRSVQLDTYDKIEATLLDMSRSPGRHGRVDLPMRIVTTPLIDVDTSGRSDYQSGIHRVVRETVSRWDRNHDIELAIWDDCYSVFRSPAPAERARVLNFSEAPAESEPDEIFEPELLVPWDTVVILPDVPIGQPAEALTGLAHCSNNSLTAVGYDLIPITSAETRPLADSMAAGEWLVPLKGAERIAGISSSATAEFTGFGAMLAAQGLAGPQVREVTLPASTAPSWFRHRNRVRREAPRIVFSGTREPHKNHRALLYAAERLWTEGLDFEVRMVGGNGWTDEHVRATIERLKADGRALVDLGRVSETVLWEELSGADVVAFASLHEGYGLPVVEALAVGTPVLTASYGSQAEIAEAGGCLTADPRDDEALVAALRRLVTDRGLRDELSRQALSRQGTTWDDYAEELWDFLVPTETPRDPR